MSAQTDPENPAAGRPNLRHYHRIAVELDATVITGDGTEVPCQVNNLSRDGVMVPCSPETLDLILPNREPVAPHVAVPVALDLRLPDAPESPIHCQCNIIYTRRVSRDCFTVGMSFTTFAEDGRQRLDDYINQQLENGA